MVSHVEKFTHPIPTRLKILKKKPIPPLLWRLSPPGKANHQPTHNVKTPLPDRTHNQPLVCQKKVTFMENDLNPLLTIVRQRLIRPRVLTTRLAGALASTFDAEDPLANMAPNCLESMEPYEVEILLSPLFTPTDEDREYCEPGLPLTGISAQESTWIIDTLAKEKNGCKLEFGDSRCQPILPEVIIDRFVRLLGLERPVAPLAVSQLGASLSGKDRFRAFSLARRAVWQGKFAKNLLEPWLSATQIKNSFSPDKMQFFSDFVRTYRPGKVAELQEALANLVESYRLDENHPVFNERLAEYQTGSIRSEHCGESVKAHRLAMAHGILADFASSEAGG